MSDTPETLMILYPASSVDRLRDRIEALEAALERIEALCSETDIINVLSAIARAALDKDVGK
jgi:hypothetical protein